MKMKLIHIILFTLTIFSVNAQQKKTDEVDKKTQEINQLINKGVDAYNTAEYEDAENKFRKVLAKDPVNPVASYDLGLTLTETERNMEAERYFEKAGKNANDSNIKDIAYFNAGNVWLAKKKYEKAIEQYKNALRNNPADEEARYNLALAKKMLKKNNKNNKNNKKKNNKKQDKKKKDKNKNDKKKNKKDNKNKKGNKNDKDKKDKNKKNKDKNGNKNKQDKKGDKKKKQGQQGQKPKKQRSKLTPQQVKQILVGLKNKEKKTQRKIALKKLKGKGRKKKSDKDW